jgi:hypothetical protein
MTDNSNSPPEGPVEGRHGVTPAPHGTQTRADAHAPNEQPKLPASIKIVAALCLMYGAVFTILSVATLFTARIEVDLLAVLCLFAGVGLLRRRRGWLVFLIWVCRLMVGAAVIIGALSIFVPDRINVRIGAAAATGAEMPVTILVLVAFVGIAGFIHWLLTRPQVTLAFAKRAQSKRT